MISSGVSLSRCALVNAPYAIFPIGAMVTTAVTAAALVVLRKERRFR